jgi:hypothetical protein
MACLPDLGPILLFQDIYLRHLDVGENTNPDQK